MRRFEVDGPAGRLSAFASGDASGGRLPAVLVHGINMSSDVWSGVIDRLGSERPVVALDLRGHGGSERKGPFAADDYAADVLAVLDAEHIERAHVAGISFGGAVACAVAARAPEKVASLAAIGSALKVEGLDVDAAAEAMRAVGVEQFFAGFLPQASFAPGTDPALIERALASAVTDRDIETVIDVSKTALTADSTDIAARVDCPALVVTGEQDMTCPPPFGQAMADALGTELVTVAGRGHVLSMEDPDGVADLLRRHFEANEATG